MKLRKGKIQLFGMTAIAILSVCTLGVTTYAWFQAEADVSIYADPSETTINVQAPEDIKFYYFKGNGSPGTAEYTGYSKSDATYGNKTNLVNTSDGTFKTSAINYTSIATFANAWEEIDYITNPNATGSGVASAKNCFDFSKMRVGCYYSFMAKTVLSTSKLDLGYRWDSTYGITGDNNGVLGTKRYVYSGGETSYPLNLLMTINAYCYASASDNATTYIKETVGVGSTLGLADKINFSNVGTGTTSASYRLLGTTAPDAGASTSTNKYIFFTIFMGKPDNSDALAYRATANSKNLFERDISTGNYSAMDKLKTTLSSVSIN